MHHPTDRIIHTTAFVTPVVEHWMEREIAQLVHPVMDQKITGASVPQFCGSGCLSLATGSTVNMQTSNNHRIKWLTNRYSTTGSFLNFNL